ncbi:TNT domain-containing protein [Frankia sp. Cr2]|uniref:TNT domain-containing protein n=1 Tax=Frankia sp. Cr2 TaxID=3073932 RepID=UPI002AD33DBC|nr:TNT domain-containing protein [Frankia sp. Cr2]
MRFRKTLVALATGVLVVGGTTSATAEDIAITSGLPVVSITPLDQCSTADFDNDRRLGPANLPLFDAVGKMLFFYDRSGGQPTQQFLDTWWDPSVQTPFGLGNWVYPANSGYYINPNGTPVRMVTTLAPGQEIDRFGGTGGNFLSPEGTRYADRSLPPSNLDSTTDPGGCDYHVYRVLKEFHVYSGAIRPWFDQPGNGRQYQLVCSLIPASQGCDPTTDALPVQWLLDNQYLAEVPPEDM